MKMQERGLFFKLKSREDLKRRLVRTDLSRWITYKNKEPYFMYLELLEKTTQSIFLQEESFNPHKEISNEILSKLPESHRPLFTRIVHSITLLNHLQRVHHLDKGYESTREDVLNAASLLQLSFNPENMLYLKTKMVYWALEEFYGTEEFTAREASLRLVVNHNTLKKHLMALRNVGYVAHVRTGKRNTYFYQLA